MNIIRTMFCKSVTMINLSTTIVFLLLAVVNSEGSDSNLVGLLSGKVILTCFPYPLTEMPHDGYNFLVFFTKPVDESINAIRVIIFNGALLSPIHVITASTAVRGLPHPCYNGFKVLVGSHTSPGIHHSIGDIQLHPRNDVDLAIVTLNSAVDFTTNCVTSTSLYADPVTNNQRFIRLGWYIFPTSGGKQEASMRMVISEILNSEPWTFTAYPDETGNVGDHGGPVIVDRRVVAVTSSFNPSRRVVHTQVYPFLDFILKELVRDRVYGEDSLYQPEQWILDLYAIHVL